ncbi:MAG: hypothetical protein PPP58_01225 [Natronomonas sp.]
MFPDSSRSIFARLLAVSGLLGITAGVGLEAYRVYLADAMLGTGSAPAWLPEVRTAVFLTSIVVVLYAPMLDEYFSGWIDVASLALVFGQWGSPIGLLLEAHTGPFSLFGYLAVVAVGLFTGMNAIVVFNYIRTAFFS